MKYYKIIENSYIVMIGVNCGGIEITEQEYNQILEVIHNKPQADEGFDYKLREDLTWELYQLPEPEEDLEQLEAEYVSRKEYEAEMLDTLENS